MKKKFGLQYTLLAILTVISLGACDKLLEVPPPPNEISIDAAFNDSSSAVSAIAGIYNLMGSHGYFEWSGLSYFTARSADDVVYNILPDYFALDSLLYTNDDVSEMWTQGFSSLLMINTCISGLQSSTALSTSLQHQLLGEAFFCRAFVYFNLVNLWGDALPLVTTPDVDINKAAKSTLQQQVYDQVIADLQQAQNLLTNTYAGMGRARPNLMAANALLARVYLYQQRYEDAISQASSVIGSGLYSLPAPAIAFLKKSHEAIWQLAPSTGNGVRGAVGDAYIYLGTFASLTPQLLAAFEPGDLRKQYWVVKDTVLQTVYNTAYKYKDKGSYGNTAPTEYYIVLRLAEQYLIRAEAEARLNQTTAAIADLNVIRARAGLQALPNTLTQAACIKAVEQERRVELFTEWGHRWFDLKRLPGIGNTSLTRADEVLGAIKTDWQPTDKWYPVPQSELQVNANLVQNPGYPAH